LFVEFGDIALNLPNFLTVLRLLMSVVVFSLLSVAAREPEPPWLLLDISLVLFIFTALTDMLDGMIARRYGMVTTFGRIADPFADKVLTAGSFIFLLGFPQTNLQPWMVVVILSREFLVSGLRGYIEGQGKQFPAMIWGKIKVTSQYSLIGWLIFHIAHLGEVTWAHYFTYAAVIAVTVWTALSGVAYLLKAVRILRSGAKGQ
jgi:CDP-diacylglycerol--glycerol-3-phosphate 3-phosphatidyltransferase